MTATITQPRHIVTIEPTAKTVTVTQETNEVIVRRGEVVQVTTAESASFDIEADISISGGRVIATDGGLATYADKDDSLNVIGISLNAAAQGDNVTVITDGRMQIAGWGLTPDSTYFLGDTGNLTTTAPTTGRYQVVGYSISATEMIVNIQQPINL